VALGEPARDPARAATGPSFDQAVAQDLADRPAYTGVVVVRGRAPGPLLTR